MKSIKSETILIQKFKKKQQKTMSKKMSKCIGTFNCFDKTLIVLSATNGGISIISFTSLIGVPVGIVSARFV